MTSLVAATVAGGYFYLNPKLPSIEGLSNVQLQVPLRIYSSDGALMGEFGEKRRTPKKLEEIPELMQQAFLSAEDDRFFELADEKGILLWQDFMFACAMYPGNKEFLDNVEKEAVYNVKRLRNHPSIALWCGDNEILSAWNRWGWKGRRYCSGTTQQ